MSITPRGMSIQEAYRLYRDEKLIVNRKYQRKLVWTQEEKSSLIDSILCDYPIPLILFAEKNKDGITKYEIIDGMQRLNAIFGFIENEFSCNNLFFDVNEFTRAKQASEAGYFEIKTLSEYLKADSCANFLDYQLAVTIFPSVSEQQVTEVFGRVNSGGRQLSFQERRQAGKINDFTSLVRVISSEIRGDASKDILTLAEMPSISIETARKTLGYSLNADDIFWCKQGILWTKQLRESEDEEIVADICASIVCKEPIARSRELLDNIYDEKTEIHSEILRKLNQYGKEKLHEEIKTTLSVLRDIIETYNPQPNTLRNIVSPGSKNPIKTAFFSIFMAFFDLIIIEEKTPVEINKIMSSLTGLQNDMISTAKYSKTEDRIKNIDKTKGLIQRYFVKKDPSMLRHGSGLALDFENSLRRSKIESNRYECKQGLIDLSDQRNLDKNLETKILETICGIANVGPDSSGYIFIGVADKKSDSERIEFLDNINPIQIGERYVVGIDRELKILQLNAEQYVKKILTFIANSELSDNLKHQVCSRIDTINYRDLTVIRIQIPPQREVSFIGEKSYIREDSSTKDLSGKKLISIGNLFK